METKSKSNFFIKLILIYFSILCLMVSMNFLFHIKAILTDSILTAIGGVLFLAIYLFILIINVLFLVRKKSVKDFKHVLLYNFIFSLFSGIGLRLPGFLLVNDLGADFSIVWLKAKAGSNFFIHYDTFNFIVKFQSSNTNEQVFGVQINLIMWAIGFFLFIFYRKFNSISNTV
jgi:hypothetical protein